MSSRTLLDGLANVWEYAAIDEYSIKYVNA